MSSKERYLEVAEGYLAGVGSGDVEAVMASLSDELEYWIAGHHGFSGTHRKAAVRDMMAPLPLIFPDGLDLVTLGAICEGNRLALEATGKAVTGTGKVYDNRYHFLFEFDGADRISRIHEYMDTGHAQEVFSE